MAKKGLKIYNPFETMEGDFFEDFFEPFKKIQFPEVRTPFVNVVDSGKSLDVSVEIPGARKEDLNVDAHEDYIKIDAKVKKEKKNEKDNYYRYEMRTSSFSRIIPMPEKIVPDKVKGELKHGVLKLKAPKKNPQNKKSKKVEIK
jgi:HSP20 family protein